MENKLEALPKDIGTAIEVLQDFADNPLVLGKAKDGPEVWRIPVKLIGPLRALLNYYDESQAYARQDKELTLEWLSNMAIGYYADLGASQKVRDEAHRTLAGIQEFLDMLKRNEPGEDAYTPSGLGKIRSMG